MAPEGINIIFVVLGNRDVNPWCLSSNINVNRLHSFH
jgi:hypothetical protein